MSVFQIAATSFPAFSGLGKSANKRQFVCLKGAGPIPPGGYYIVAREPGGLLGPLRDLFNVRSEWFALYADDGKVDDEMLCNEVKRGSFRLHPKGTWLPARRVMTPSASQARCLAGGGRSAQCWLTRFTALQHFRGVPLRDASSYR